jgi:hypothetical protein
MAHSYNGGCDTCKHHLTDVCEGCEHYYDLEDLYEETSPEEIAAVEERERQRNIAEAISEYIECDLPDTFLQAYDTAKTFVARNHFRPVLMGVKITEDKHIIACDSYMLIDIPCPDIPDQLKGKIVMSMDGNKVGITNLLYPDHIPIFSAADDFKKAILQCLPQEQILGEKGYGDSIQILALHTPQGEICFDDTRINKVKSALSGEIIVQYKDATRHAIFIGHNARAAVCPLRP